MNHPHHNEWVPYLFGEAGSNEKRILSEHLSQCDECRQEVAAWQRSLGKLNAWTLPAMPRKQTVELFAPIWKWATAALLVLVLGIGFTVGRWSSVSADANRLRQQIEPQLRQQLKQEFALMLQQQMEQAESQRLADYVALKADLDTVAVMTETGLRRAERQLVQLAGYAQPANYSESSKP